MDEISRLKVGSTSYNVRDDYARDKIDILDDGVSGLRSDVLDLQTNVGTNTSNISNLTNTVTNGLSEINETLATHTNDISNIENGTKVTGMSRALTSEQVGSDGHPVYFENGVPVECTYTVSEYQRLQSDIITNGLDGYGRELSKDDFTKDNLINGTIRLGDYWKTTEDIELTDNEVKLPEGAVWRVVDINTNYGLPSYYNDDNSPDSVPQQNLQVYGVMIMLESEFIQNEAEYLFPSNTVSNSGTIDKSTGILTRGGGISNTWHYTYSNLDLICSNEIAPRMREMLDVNCMLTRQDIDYRNGSSISNETIYRQCFIPSNYQLFGYSFGLTVWNRNNGFPYHNQFELFKTLPYLTNIKNKSYWLNEIINSGYTVLCSFYDYHFSYNTSNKSIFPVFYIPILS